MATPGVSLLNVTLEPVNEGLPAAFSDVYIKGLSVLRVTFTPPVNATGEEVYTVKLGSVEYSSGERVIEIPLRSSGKKSIVCTMKIGLECSATKKIYVREYAPPKVVPMVKYAKDIVCSRCSGDGTVSTAGEYLRLRLMRSYAPVTDGSGKDQRNFCRVQYRWKDAYAQDYSEWIQLRSGEDLSADTVDRVIADQVLSVKNAYTVQVAVTDDMGNSHVITKAIPATYDTPLHLGKGGRNVGIGQYCDYSHQDAVDIGWKAFFNAGIGTRTVFRAESETGWQSGQLLSEAFPDADNTLIDQGTLFLAVIFHRFNTGVASAPTIHKNLTPVICVKAADSVAGQTLNTIAGCGVCRVVDKNFGIDLHEEYRVNITYDNYDSRNSWAFGGSCLRHTPGGDHQEMMTIDEDNKMYMAALYVLL